MTIRILRFLLATSFLLVGTHALALAPPSDKKVVLDLREIVEPDLASNRRIQGLLELQSATLLSKKLITEDRCSATVRLVKVRNKRPLPPVEQVTGYRYQDVEILWRMPTGVKLVEEIEVMYRLRQGEWHIENVRQTKVDAAEFQLAYKLAQLDFEREQRTRQNPNPAH